MFTLPRRFFISTLIGLIIGASLINGGQVFASLSGLKANEWSKFCADNPGTCSKNENPGSRSGSVSCPVDGQTISQILVHAGDGQDVSELPDDKFSYSENGSTVTISALEGSHDLSWIMVVCTTPPPPPTDVCPNLEGVQADVPEGYQLVNGSCDPIENNNPPTDVCPNIDGDQAQVPDGYELVDGTCQLKTQDNTPPPVDLCPNIDATQSAIPDGYELVDGSCLLKNQDTGNSESSGGDNNSGNNNNNTNNSGQVLAAATTQTSTGSVLGASTFAATGVSDHIQGILFGLGLISQSAGGILIFLRRRI